MTIIDYLLIAGVGAAAIYTVYRLFVGWRNSALPHGENEIAGELKVSAEAQPGRRVATGALWKSRPEPSD